MARLVRYELGRAVAASFSLSALLALVFTAGLMAAIVAAGRQIGADGATPGSATGIIGALWAAAAGISVNERNRQTLVEDIWWWLEPRPLLQSVAIFLPWAVIAWLQGALVALSIATFVEASAPRFIDFLLGFTLGLPAGLFFGALARLVRGASVVMGISLISALLFMAPIRERIFGLGQETAALTAIGIGAYGVICGALWFIVASRAPR